MDSWISLTVTVVGGLLVLGIAALIGQFIEARRLDFARILMTRRGYLERTLELSRDHASTSLDAHLPTLRPVDGNTMIAKIQEAWRSLATHGSVRIITSPSDESLEAAFELLAKGVKVRVAYEHDAGSLSFHLFKTQRGHYALLNHRRARSAKARAVEFGSVLMVDALGDHFEKLWDRAVELPTFVAQRCFRTPHAAKDAIAAEFRRQSVSLRLDVSMQELVLRRVATLMSLRFTLILGLPGAGKSRLRKVLEDVLNGLGLSFVSLTDYPHLYSRFVRDLLAVTPSQRFETADGGGFIVKDPTVFEEAFAETVLEAGFASDINDRVSIVEVARANNLAAIQSLSSRVRDRLAVFYVQAPEGDRNSRLDGRSRNPEITVEGEVVEMRLFNDHPLAGEARQAIYSKDDLDALKRILGHRLILVDNPDSDPRALELQLLDQLETMRKALSSELSFGV